MRKHQKKEAVMYIQEENHGTQAILPITYTATSCPSRWIFLRTLTRFGFDRGGVPRPEASPPRRDVRDGGFIARRACGPLVWLMPSLRSDIDKGGVEVFDRAIAESLAMDSSVFIALGP